jgi:hypothetical protein
VLASTSLVMSVDTRIFLDTVCCLLEEEVLTVLRCCVCFCLGININPVKDVTIPQLHLLNKANYCCWSSYCVSYIFFVFPECKHFVILIKF